MDEFKEKVKTWVYLDDQIKELNEQLKFLRDQRTLHSEDIIRYADSSNLNNVSISDGQLRFTNGRSVQPLTLRFVEDCLYRCIPDREKVKTLMTYIKESRKINNIPEIKRTYL